MIRLPFHLLSPLVERRMVQTHIDMGISLALVGSIFFISIVPALPVEILPFDQGLISLACAITALLGIGWQMLTAGSRYVKRRFIPVLGPSLKPLRPTEGELKAALAELKADRQKMATRLKIADLQKYFESPCRYMRSAIVHKLVPPKKEKTSSISHDPRQSIST